MVFVPAAGVVLEATVVVDVAVAVVVVLNLVVVVVELWVVVVEEVVDVVVDVVVLLQAILTIRTVPSKRLSIILASLLCMSPPPIFFAYYNQITRTVKKTWGEKIGNFNKWQGIKITINILSQKFHYICFENCPFFPDYVVNCRLKIWMLEAKIPPICLFFHNHVIIRRRNFMDEIDRRLISQLRINPRQSNKELAKSLQIDSATVQRRIGKLISSGAMILTVFPDLKMFGYACRVFMLVQADHSELRKIEKFLCNSTCLRYVSQSVGDADFFIRGDFPSIEKSAHFVVESLAKIPGITNIETMLVYEELKRSFIPVRPPQPAAETLPSTKSITINQNDRDIILLLQKDSRVSLKHLAEKIGLSKTTIHRRINDLVAMGAIKFAIMPDDDKFGFPERCNLRIRTAPEKIRQVAETISKYDYVDTVALISGPTQVWAGIQAPSVKHLLDYVKQDIREIDGVIRVDSMTFLHVLKNNYTWLAE